MKVRSYRKSDAKAFLSLVRALARYEDLKPPTAAATQLSRILLEKKITIEWGTGATNVPALAIAKKLGFVSSPPVLTVTHFTMGPRIPDGDQTG